MPNVHIQTTLLTDEEKRTVQLVRAQCQVDLVRLDRQEIASTEPRYSLSMIDPLVGTCDKLIGAVQYLESSWAERDKEIKLIIQEFDTERSELNREIHRLSEELERPLDEIYPNRAKVDRASRQIKNILSTRVWDAEVLTALSIIDGELDDLLKSSVKEPLQNANGVEHNATPIQN